MAQKVKYGQVRGERKVKEQNKLMAKSRYAKEITCPRNDTTKVLTEIY